MNNFSFEETFVGNFVEKIFPDVSQIDNEMGKYDKIVKTNQKISPKTFINTRKSARKQALFLFWQKTVILIKIRQGGAIFNLRGCIAFMLLDSKMQKVRNIIENV